MSKIKDLIDKLYQEHDLRDEDLLYILDNIDEESMDYLFYLASSSMTLMTATLSIRPLLL